MRPEQIEAFQTVGVTIADELIAAMGRRPSPDEAERLAKIAADEMTAQAVPAIKGLAVRMGVPPEGAQQVERLAEDFVSVVTVAVFVRLTVSGDEQRGA